MANLLVCRVLLRWGRYHIFYQKTNDEGSFNIKLSTERRQSETLMYPYAREACISVAKLSSE